MWIRVLFVCLGLTSLRSASAQDVIDDPTTLESMEEVEDDPGAQMATAIDSGSVAAVRRLLDGGMSPNILVYDEPAMQYAIWGDHYYVVKLLVDRGADVNSTGEDGFTSLMGAALVGNIRIAKFLLDKGADIDAVDKTYGLTVLQNACDKESEAVFDLLVKRGADIQHVDKHGGNCLEEAAFNGANSIAEKLRAKGLKTKWPLHVACGLGEMEQVNKLLAEGVDASQANDGWKNTPMHFAANNGHLAVAKLLKEQGAEVNAKNLLGATPLHYAAENDDIAMTKWLLEQGADINAADEDGMTPRDWSGAEADEFLASKGAKYGEWADESGE